MTHKTLLGLVGAAGLTASAMARARPVDGFSLDGGGGRSTGGGFRVPALVGPAAFQRIFIS